MTDAKDLVLQAPNAVLRAETAEKAVALCEALRECGASLNAYKMQNQGLSIRKNSVRIKLSQRQFGIEVRKYEMLSGIYIRWFY